MKTKKSPREKSEKELLEDVRALLILLITKGKATQEEVGKCLGVGGKQINNILRGVGRGDKKKNAKKTKK